MKGVRSRISIKWDWPATWCWKSSGLTRSVLAEKIGTSPAYITKFLKGETNFTLDSMVKIAKALKCELAIGLFPTLSSDN